MMAASVCSLISDSDICSSNLAVGDISTPESTLCVWIKITPYIMHY